MEYRDIVHAATEQGWREKQIKKGWRLIPPDPSKQAVTVHRSPSDVRTLRNLLAEMRRQGLVWPWPPQKRRRGEKGDGNGET